MSAETCTGWCLAWVASAAELGQAWTGERQFTFTAWPCMAGVSSGPGAGICRTSSHCVRSSGPPCCRYLVLFLKFIASVVPTIEYDYTMAAGGQQ